MNNSVERRYIELTEKYYKGHLLTDDEKRDLRDCKKYLFGKIAREERAKRKRTEQQWNRVEQEWNKIEIFSYMAHLTDDIAWQNQLKKDAKVFKGVIKSESR